MKEEYKHSFQDFWDDFTQHHDDSWMKDNFLRYLSVKKRYGKYSFSEWYDFYIEYLLQDKHIDASTTVYDKQLSEEYSYEVYEDGGKHFVLRNPTALSNSWHFVRRFRVEQFANDFCLHKNKDLKPSTSVTESIISDMINACNRNPTTNIKTVMQWLIEDKFVVYRPIHPYISDAETDEWEALDPENPKLSSDYEYQLSEKVQHSWKVNIPSFEVYASCRQEAVQKAVDYVCSNRNIIVEEI